VDRIDYPGVTLRSCAAFAYGLKEFQISGPAWLGELKYDIVAKGPDGTVRTELPGMMKALLAERFQLEAHEETKEFNVFALVVGKNSIKVKELPPDPEREAAGGRMGMSMTGTGVGRLEVKNGTMTSLANTLARMLGRPVIDLTALTGRYDMELEYSTEDANAMRLAAPPGSPGAPPQETGISVFGSLQQAGLKLEARRISLPSIVVDRAEKAPSGN
jgi:uncharacterized protein (TIGR03435 family)